METEIANLAKVLHENGEKILNGCCKLSVNAALLQKLGVELGNFSTEGLSSSNQFEVLSPQHASSVSIDHLQFLHDIFQKTPGLKVVNNANLLSCNDKIDLSKFKKLKYLELKHVPVKQLIGLKQVQYQMECIVCERGLSTLEHLLAECGGDNATGFVWSELTEAVLSFNDIRIVDSSVAFAPRLQVLDLSHNQIFDVNAIERLPNLKYVNLSYNSLGEMPQFNKSARKKIEVLIMRNNYIESLDGLAGLDVLRELDISNNLVCCQQEFQHFLAMSALQLLTVKGNPICTLSANRTTTIKFLHINASFGNFTLDGVPLSKKERELVGMELVKNCPFYSPELSLIPNEVPPSTSQPPSEVVATEKTKRKSRKARQVAIPDMDGTYEDLSSSRDLQDIAGPSKPSFLLERSVEDLKHEKLAWPKLPHPLSSTPYDDACLEAILNEVEPDDAPGTTTITTTATIEAIPPHIQEKMKSENDTFHSCTDDPDTDYHSLETPNKAEREEKDSSPDIEAIPEEDQIEDEAGLYQVVRLRRENSTIRREEIFLCLTEMELRELDVSTGQVIGKWYLTALESATKTSSTEVHLVYDTIFRDRRERVYELEPSEATDLHSKCRKILEERSLSEMSQTTFKCVSCSSGFVVENKNRLTRQSPSCPICGSKKVLEDEIPSPATRSSSETPPKVKQPAAAAHTRSASDGVPPKFDQSKEAVGKCSSHSSIGSAASLDDRNPSKEQSSERLPKSDSDVEIMSNPSQSSIEVIEPPDKPKAEKIMPPAMAAFVFAGLTESSSSGSITDSICTAYENSSMVSSGQSKKLSLDTTPITEVPDDDGEVKDVNESFHKSAASNDIHTLLQDVLEKFEERVAKTPRKGEDKDIDLIEYNYQDFAVLDHRIKLFLYAHLFEDNSEECLFLLRGQVLTANDENSFDACIVCSNFRIYVLRITGKEEGEEASKFLRKVDPLTFEIGALKKWRTLLWKHGFSVKFSTYFDKTVQYLILLKEPNWTLNFISFMTPHEKLFPNCKWLRSFKPAESLRVTQFLMSSAADSTLLAAAGVCQLHITEEENKSAVVSEGVLLVTPTDLLIVSSLNRVYDSKRGPFPDAVASQKLIDLMQASVKDRELGLQFLEEVKGEQVSWSIKFASEPVLSQVLNAIRAKWEDLFSVPLQVTADENF